MALDKIKKILIDIDFDINQLSTHNIKANICPQKTLPYLSNDVTLDKRQTVGFSLNYMLKNLLDNDKFIERYYNNSKDRIGKNKERIVEAFKFGDGKTMPTDNKIYNTLCADHINNYHINSELKLSAVQLQYMNSDCSNFDKINARRSTDPFQKTMPLRADVKLNGNMSLSGDVLVKVEYDDSEEVRKAYNYIQVAVCNHKTDGNFKQNMNNVQGMLKRIPSLKDDIKYIYKEWLSGMKELYIYLPSTFTFYNEHYDTDSPNIKQYATFIRVNINKRHFGLTHIYHTDIVGQSLPLQIHNEHQDQYVDIIQPSILRSLCMSNNTLNNVDCIYNENTNLMTLYFACYGTDAQAIRIYGD